MSMALLLTAFNFVRAMCVFSKQNVLVTVNNPQNSSQHKTALVFIYFPNRLCFATVIMCRH